MSNNSDDKLDKAIARVLRDNILSFKEMLLEPSKQQNSIVVWLVGISTGAIAIMFSQMGKLSSNLYPVLKWSVGFLIATIICGMLFRIFHQFLLARDISDIQYIVSWVSGMMQPSEVVPTELPEAEETLKQVRCLLDQYTAIIGDLEGEPPLKREDFEKRDKSKGVRKRRLRKCCRVLYTLMCASFAISMLLIGCAFIITDVNPATVSTIQKVSPSSQQVQPTPAENGQTGNIR